MKLGSEKMKNRTKKIVKLTIEFEVPGHESFGDDYQFDKKRNFIQEMYVFEELTVRNVKCETWEIASQDTKTLICEIEKKIENKTLDLEEALVYQSKFEILAMLFKELSQKYFTKKSAIKSLSENFVPRERWRAQSLLRDYIKNDLGWKQ